MNSTKGRKNMNQNFIMVKKYYIYLDYVFILIT